jgi:hypothetical protein
MGGVVALQLHPRDIGKLLIAYAQGVVVYSFKMNQCVRRFEYVVPAGAPGGDGVGVEKERRPRVVQAVWHPTGTFVLTAHEDGSLVFWDAKDGRMVAARSVDDTKVNEVGRKGGKPTPRTPFGKIKWCCKQNPDDTALLIAGGQAVDEEQKGLTFLELGPTPTYATSSWEVLASHFEGKRRLTLPIPPGAQVADYLLIPRTTPFFDGAQDPIAVLVMLTSGELINMTFPSGYPISPTNMLHPSMSFVHPFVQKIAVCTMPRERWLGMAETRSQGDAILAGGAPGAKWRRSGWDFRNIIQVAHADSTIRIWDVGYDDEIENPMQLQVDVARALDRFEDVSVTALAMANTTGEFAAGTRTGEVVIYKWGGNRNYGRDATKPLDPNPGGLTDISSRSEPSLKDGLQPFVLYEMMQGPISVITVSDVGFIAVGSEGGFFSIIDLRGPKIIFQASMTDFIKEEKRSSFLKGSSKGPATKGFPTAIEFGVLTLEGDAYSSIACFVGTNLGHVATFKILPSGQSYSAQLVGVTKCGSDKVVAICPLNSDNGQPAAAVGHAVAGLREGRQVNGVLVVGKSLLGPLPSRRPLTAPQSRKPKSASSNPPPPRAPPSPSTTNSATPRASPKSRAAASPSSPSLATAPRAPTPSRRSRKSAAPPCPCSMPAAPSRPSSRAPARSLAGRAPPRSPCCPSGARGNPCRRRSTSSSTRSWCSRRARPLATCSGSRARSMSVRRIWIC